MNLPAKYGFICRIRFWQMRGSEQAAANLTNWSGVVETPTPRGQKGCAVLGCVAPCAGGGGDTSEEGGLFRSENKHICWPAGVSPAALVGRTDDRSSGTG